LRCALVRYFANVSSAPSPTQRLFIALSPPEPVRAVVAALCTPLREVRWTPFEQLHVTLRFLGETPTTQRDVLLERLATVRVEPFPLPVEGIGVFPQKGPPRVLWVGVGSGHPRLHQLRQRIDDALLTTGLEVDLRTFHPHITVGRCSEKASAAVHAWTRTHREFAARTSHAILERYGMTETNMNTSNPYDGERVPGSVGLPLPGTSIRIADPASGKEVATGEVGQIEIKGPNVFKGYWRSPEKTKAEFRADGYFMSGDQGFRDEKGYVHIVGRNKDLIISGGFNVYPAEVESVIDELDGVAQCAVVGAPHPDFGEAVIAVVVPKPGSVLEESRIAGVVVERLANYKRPKRILIVPELPLNAMGKVQKNILRERYRDIFQ